MLLNGLCSQYDCEWRWVDGRASVCRQSVWLVYVFVFGVVHPEWATVDGLKWKRVWENSGKRKRFCGGSYSYIPHSHTYIYYVGHSRVWTPIRYTSCRAPAMNLTLWRVVRSRHRWRRRRRRQRCRVRHPSYLSVALHCNINDRRIILHFAHILTRSMYVCARERERASWMTARKRMMTHWRDDTIREFTRRWIRFCSRWLPCCHVCNAFSIHTRIYLGRCETRIANEISEVRGDDEKKTSRKFRW